MSDVVDLLAYRERRGEPCIHFATASEAIHYATRQVRELQHLAESRLVLTAADFEVALSQVAAVLSEVTRLHAALPHEEGNG